MGNTNNDSPAILSLGFRPFFLSAALFSVIAMVHWLLTYSFNIDVGIHHIPPLYWHAHEMIFGYGMAVIAGFLLTAMTNWTGIKTVSGYPLLLMVVFWLSARIMPFLAIESSLVIMLILDSLFFVYLVAVLSWPVIKTRQWKQVGILSKILLLLIANVVFYLGALDKLDHGMRWGNYAGLYLILALILMMARRVIPFFIEKGCGLDSPLTNWRWLDISSMIIFLLFMVSDIVYSSGKLTTTLAIGLALLHSLRLYHWHVKGIWSRPLLWVLYLAYSFITLGFFLKAAVYFFEISDFVALHAFAVGGIGLLTLGMMARVSLGHTGRQVDNPPPALLWLFALLTTAAVVRVIFPLIETQYYSLWVLSSQVMWIVAFSGFFVLYFPVLSTKNKHED